ncbi:hypothetical protein BC937DRAFT_86674 [Endogone sp. FLAS-F59071]|nr:hypothetical protein BC937DRAFT_86674 [Endogone sp. FLAS-F59071]|eukprot:RUS22814.1 hypothetical protein BC937DRAFT_86674 [Endogone sp. FLAS-F59071]
MSGLDQYMNQTPASDWSPLGFLKFRAMQSDFTGQKDKEHYRYQMSLKAVQLLDEFTVAEKENAKLCLDNLKNEADGKHIRSFWHGIAQEGLKSKLKTVESELKIFRKKKHAMIERTSFQHAELMYSTAQEAGEQSKIVQQGVTEIARKQVHDAVSDSLRKVAEENLCKRQASLGGPLSSKKVRISLFTSYRNIDNLEHDDNDEETDERNTNNKQLIRIYAKNDKVGEEIQNSGTKRSLDTTEDSQECCGLRSSEDGKGMTYDDTLHVHEEVELETSKTSVQVNDTISLKWEFDSPVPSWLTKAAKLRSNAAQSEAATKALYWRIVDASNPAVISEFSSEEFEELNAIFASTFKRGGSKENLEPSAERCLQILDKLDWEQLKFIGSLVKVKGIQGAVQEVRKLSKGFENKKHDQGLFDDEVDEVPALLGDLLEEDCLEDDVGYIFELLRYACEWIKKSIPQRHNSERDVDMFVKSHIFSCLDGITDQHFGEMVSRASRDRRVNALDSPDNTEGYHIDWMFTNFFGSAMIFRMRLGVKNFPCILLDTLRVQKTMRDMHRALTGNIFAAGNGAVSKPVLNAFTKLLMPGFVSSYFFIRTILVVYVGAGFYASIQLSEFNIPTTYDQLGNIVNIAREMLRVKKILRSTISSFKAMKARADREKFEPGRIKLINSPPEFGTPSRKRISRKVSCLTYIVLY